MNTICLFGSDYATAKDLHAALRDMLALPSYYGMNADALNDCLGELPAVPALWVGDHGEGETAEALSRVIRVFRDNGAAVTEL